jgi:hypothetical protein
MQYKDFIETRFTIFEYTEYLLHIYEPCRHFAKRKIDLLKKKKNGPERQTLARPAQIRGLPRVRLAE